MAHLTSNKTQPLVAVIGATGTGKSQLAIEIAKRHNGEVINGDAMQLYAGLPIITNKVTDAEKAGIPHHLLGCIPLHEPTWEVGKFVKAALEAIAEIRSRGKLPVLVGGTHYYTQSLLFRLAMEQNDEGNGHDNSYVINKEERWPILRASTEVILQELRKVDPVMADRWHPRDRRKIQRSLEIYLQTGKTASCTYAEQRQRQLEQAENQKDNGEDMCYMRMPTLLFWVHAENSVLKQRLSNRVDKMIVTGLLDEVQSLDSYADGQRKAGHTVDETRGIWVSIGFKEFTSYLKAVNNEESMASLTRMKAEAVEKTKAATRQYAKRQLRWIRIKLLNSLRAANALDKCFLLDGTDVNAFQTNVVAPALQLTENWLDGAQLPEPTSLSDAAAEMLVAARDYDLSAKPEKWFKRECELCRITAVTEEQWHQHVKSKLHRRLSSKNRAVTKEEPMTQDQSPGQDIRLRQVKEPSQVNIQGNSEKDGSLSVEVRLFD